MVPSILTPPFFRKFARLRAVAAVVALCFFPVLAYAAKDKTGSAKITAPSGIVSNGSGGAKYLFVSATANTVSFGCEDFATTNSSFTFTGTTSYSWTFTNATPTSDTKQQTDSITFNLSASNPSATASVKITGTVQNSGTGQGNCTLTGTDSVTVLSVAIEPDSNMVGVVGGVVSGSQDGSEKHFVSPKKTSDVPGDYVVLKATGVDASQFSSLLEWEGGEAVSGAPLKRQVSRNSTGKTVVKIKIKQGGAEVEKMNVWVVWVTLSLNTTQKSTDNNLSFPSYSAMGTTADFLNGVEIKGDIEPTTFTGFSNTSFSFKQTMTRGVWYLSGTWQLDGSFAGPDEPDDPASQAVQTSATNAHIYSIDSPGLLPWKSGDHGGIVAENRAYKGTFKTWVQLSIANKSFKCSNDLEWHSEVWTKYDFDTATEVRDTNKTNAAGTGKLDVKNSSNPN